MRQRMKERELLEIKLPCTNEISLQVLSAGPFWKNPATSISYTWAHTHMCIKMYIYTLHFFKGQQFCLPQGESYLHETEY